VCGKGAAAGRAAPRDVCRGAYRVLLCIASSRTRRTTTRPPCAVSTRCHTDPHA
jgi:hypothetical protein